MTKIYLYAEDGFVWFVMKEPASETLAIAKAPARHLENTQTILQDGFWYAIQQLAIKFRFAFPIEVYLPNRKMKKGFIKPIFREELKRILQSDYKDEHIILKTYGRFSPAKKFFKNISSRHRGEPSIAIQKPLKGPTLDW